MIQTNLLWECTHLMHCAHATLNLIYFVHMTNQTLVDLNQPLNHTYFDHVIC